MLVLLIIMMIVAPLLQQGVAVQLPKGKNTVDKPETQGQTVVAISKNKELYLNAKPITENELTTKITELLEGKAEKVVLIKADEEVEYAAVMAAMDQLRSAGIEDIGLIVDPKKAPGEAGGSQ
jgi:biopolymer transport protein ExbD